MILTFQVTLKKRTKYKTSIYRIVSHYIKIEPKRNNKSMSSMWQWYFTVLIASNYFNWFVWCLKWTPWISWLLHRTAAIATKNTFNSLSSVLFFFHFFVEISCIRGKNSVFVFSCDLVTNRPIHSRFRLLSAKIIFWCVHD